MTLLSPGVQITHTDVSRVVKPVWTEWKRTFLFLPKTTITGNKVIGFAWTRAHEFFVGEDGETIGFYIAPEEREYVRSKKEIFVDNLKGE